VELVAIIAIIAILAAIIAPRFARSIAVQRADAIARRMVFDLALVRQRARSTGVSQAFRAWLGRYAILGMPDPDDSSTGYVVRLDRDPYNATLVSVSFDNGDDTVMFDPYGIPDTGGDIVISVGDQVRTIHIDLESGKATIQ